MVVQVRFALSPVATFVGRAVSATDGGDEGEVVGTVTVWLPEPPGPIQVSVKALVALNAPVLAEPDVGRGPLQAPPAVQEVASVLDQVSVEALPATTLAGLALIDTVGAAVAGAVGGDADSVFSPPLHPKTIAEANGQRNRNGEVWEVDI